MWNILNVSLNNQLKASEKGTVGTVSFLLFLKMTVKLVAIFKNCIYDKSVNQNSKGVFLIKLKDIASISQGAYVARLETSKEDELAVEVRLLTLKEFNETLGLAYRMQDKDQKTYIKETKLSDHLFTKENRLIVHLLSQKAALLPEEYWNLLVPSNFVILDFVEEIDARFMEWYINEHPAIRRQIMLGTQGSSVSALSLAHIRDIDVNLPPISIQKAIGCISQLQRKKKSLAEERLILEEQMIQHKIMEKMEEYK